MKRPVKHYVIRKYVAAPSIAAALKAERDAPVDDVWLDEDFHKRSFHQQQPRAAQLGIKPRVPRKRAKKRA